MVKRKTADIARNPTLELHAAFQTAYDHFNQSLFESRLPSCVITLNRTGRQIAFVKFDSWMGRDSEQVFVDEISLNPEYFPDLPIAVFCQNLCHEMAHIWQHHFGRPRINYHNKQWAERMMNIGLYPSTTGIPGGESQGERVGDYIVFEGRFYVACKELLQSGFHIPWVLRFSNSTTRKAAEIKIFHEDGRVVTSIDQLFLRTFKTAAELRKGKP